MNFLISTLLLWISALCMSGAHADAYSEAMNNFNKSDQLQRYLKTAYGYAVFPTITKAAIALGGARGSGVVYEKGMVVGTSTLTQLSIGLQLGGQAFSQIILFEDKATLDDFKNNQFQFSAQATAIAITANASAQTGTTGNSATASATDAAHKAKAQYSHGMMIFTTAKGGLMYEASVAGQKFSFTPIGS